MSYITIALNRTHSKKEFCSGKDLLDNYLKRQASQDVKRKLSACFVICDDSDSQVQGYYTLSNSSIPLELVPDKFKKQLPKSYTAVPTTLLGRLAVDKTTQGKGLGKFLLVDALKRCYDLSEKIGSYVVVVDPIDGDAESYYEKYGFIKLPDSGKMFLPTKTISQLFRD